MGKNIKMEPPWRYDSKFIALSDYQDIFWNIFESGQFGVAMTDESGKVLLQNTLFSTDVIGNNTSVDLSKISGLTEGVRIINSDLTEFTVHANYRVVKLCRMKLPGKPGGAVYLWFSHLAPDTTKKQIRILKNLYRSFIDSTFELVFRTSRDERLLFANRLFIKTFGFESYRKSKQTFIEDLFEDPLGYRKFKQRVLDEKTVFGETINFRKQDGSRLIGLVNCQLHNDDKGEPVLNWTVLDISERIAFEQDLRKKNEQLAKINSQMDRFLYSTSHDLRSPITSILGLVNLMKLETKEEAILDYVKKIEDCTQRLDNIIKDIMSFSKTNYQRIKSQKIEFESLIWSVINSHRAETDFGKIFFEVKISGEDYFYSDQERVEIILGNLVRNAIAFYDANKVRPFVRINATVRPEDAVFEVIDNGIGIPAQHLNSVFNMFYKASERSKGAGLGLYIVKESVQQLKGEVQLESEVGFGSVLRFLLPNDTKGRLINRKLKLQRGV